MAFGESLKKYFHKSTGIKTFAFVNLMLLVMIAGACQPANKPSNDERISNGDNGSNRTMETSVRQPTIEAAPVEAGADNYKIVTGDALKLSVNAAAAREVEFFYQPITASDRSLKLKTSIQQSGDNFTTELKTPMDFNGEVWARVRYSDGEIKETEHLQLATQTALVNEQNNQPDTDESARDDKVTGGRIERAALQPGNGDVRITVNVPAFQLTLWQGGKEVATYYVGVGRKNFPIPIQMREAKEIILNPDWIPPDSDWVRRSGVEPYERIPANDPDNPLGKIKYPLGQAYLLHEAQSPSDIGNLVSHGCVRIMRDDIFDLTKKIAVARDLPISTEEIEQARNNSNRRVIKLGEPLTVDINYDTMVVESGILHIYPDVYERDTNTIEKLRAKLENHEVDISKLDDATLKKMLERVSRTEQFVVSLADIRAGNALTGGKTVPLTPQQAKESKKTASKDRP